MPLLYPLLPLQGTQSILRGEAHQAGGHDLVLVLPLQDHHHHQVQLVEKTSRGGVDFPEIWLCPSPSFSFQRLANLGYMYIYLYLVWQLSSMSCWQIFFKAGEQLLPRKEQEWGKVQVCFKKLENFKWFVSRSFAPLDIVQEKDNLTFPAEYCTIQFWESQNEWKHPTFYQPSPRPGQNDPLIFFLVSSWTNVITTKWWFNTHALLFFNNVPYVMQGTHDFND